MRFRRCTQGKDVRRRRKPTINYWKSTRSIQVERERWTTTGWKNEPACLPAWLLARRVYSEQGTTRRIEAKRYREANKAKYTGPLASNASYVLHLQESTRKRRQELKRQMTRCLCVWGVCTPQWRTEKRETNETNRSTSHEEKKIQMKLGQRKKEKEIKSLPSLRNRNSYSALPLLGCSKDIACMYACAKELLTKKQRQFLECICSYDTRSISSESPSTLIQEGALNENTVSSQINVRCKPRDETYLPAHTRPRAAETEWLLSFSCLFSTSGSNQDRVHLQVIEVFRRAQVSSYIHRCIYFHVVTASSQ